MDSQLADIKFAQRLSSLRLFRGRIQTRKKVLSYCVDSARRKEFGPHRPNSEMIVRPGRRRETIQGSPWLSEDSSSARVTPREGTIRSACGDFTEGFPVVRMALSDSQKCALHV